jgi:hypothetical protein
VARFVGGSLHGETARCSTEIVYFRVSEEGERARFEEYRRDRRACIFSGIVELRNSTKGLSTTLERRPVTTLVPL